MKNSSSQILYVYFRIAVTVIPVFSFSIFSSRPAYSQQQDFQNRNGGAGQEQTRSITKNKYGGFVTSGNSFTTTAGGADFHVRRMNLNGTKIWEKCGRDRTRELVRNLEYRADLMEELSRPLEASWLREKAREWLASAEQPTQVAARHAG